MIVLRSKATYGSSAARRLKTFSHMKILYKGNSWTSQRSTGVSCFVAACILTYCVDLHIFFLLHLFITPFNFSYYTTLPISIHFFFFILFVLFWHCGNVMITTLIPILPMLPLLEILILLLTIQSSMGRHSGWLIYFSVPRKRKQPKITNLLPKAQKASSLPHDWWTTVSASSLLPPLPLNPFPLAPPCTILAVEFLLSLHPLEVGPFKCLSFEIPLLALFPFPAKQDFWP